MRTNEKYTKYLLNPGIPAELKANFKWMVATLQAKILAADSKILATAAGAVAPVTPHRAHSSRLARAPPAPAGVRKSYLGSDGHSYL